MLVKDLVTSVKYSELHSASVKDKTDVIVTFINLGMLELYKRFPIKIEEYIVNLVTGTVNYSTPSNFMYATDAFMEAPADSDEVYVPISINEEDDPYSIFFNSWNKIQVPGSITGSYISIVYVAKPAYVTLAQAEDGVTELDLPDTLVDCLLSYIGWKGHLSIKSDSKSTNNAHWARFERSCDKAIELGIAAPSDNMSMNERLYDRGFA